VGIGGGIVCDISGFVASTFLRGLPFGFVPTTVLSQADASLGGKNGINFQGFKNLIGTFRQPSFIFCDPDMLSTLSDEEYLSGFAEIVKHAAICSKSLLQVIEENIDRILERDKDLLLKLILESVKIKASVVEKDVNEEGPRRLLNYGHTFGHALEKVYNLKHGEAIALGMIIANRYSIGKGYLVEGEAERLRNVCERLSLVRGISPDKKSVWDALIRDKKKYRDEIHFVQVKELGKGFIEKIPLRDLESFFRDFSM
jgi:3-dehydroquinate synthase